MHVFLGSHMQINGMIIYVLFSLSPANLKQYYKEASKLKCEN